MNHNYEELKQSVEAEHPTAWRPDTDEDHPKTLVGLVTAQREVTTRLGNPVLVFEVRDPDAAMWSLWAIGIQLSEKLADVKANDAVAVHYRGTRTSAEGRQYRDYTVRVVPGAAGKRSSKAATEEAA